MGPLLHLLRCYFSPSTCCVQFEGLLPLLRGFIFSPCVFVSLTYILVFHIAKMINMIMCTLNTKTSIHTRRSIFEVTFHFGRGNFKVPSPMKYKPCTSNLFHVQ